MVDVKTMDSAVGSVLAARENLRKSQKTAREVLAAFMSERKEISFKPSDFWAAHLGKDPKALQAALAEDGVQPIQYTDDRNTPREGMVKAIRREGGGLSIDLVDLESYREVTISDEATWDADILLDFCVQFM